MLVSEAEAIQKIVEMHENRILRHKDRNVNLSRINCVQV